MPSREFPKQDLQDLVWEGDLDQYVKLVDEITDTSRWSVHYHLVFKYLGDNKYYSTTYARGATEYQDEQPFEYADDLISCDEVKQVKKTIIDYEPV